MPAVSARAGLHLGIMEAPSPANVVRDQRAEPDHHRGNGRVHSTHRFAAGSTRHRADRGVGRSLSREGCRGSRKSGRSSAGRQGWPQDLLAGEARLSLERIVRRDGQPIPSGWNVVGSASHRSSQERVRDEIRCDLGRVMPRHAEFSSALFIDHSVEVSCLAHARRRVPTL